jgi:hypothetical protein
LALTVALYGKGELRSQLHVLGSKKKSTQETAMGTRDILAIMFAAVAIIGVIGGIWNRLASGKGIGGKFVQFIALVVALPIAATFVLQDMVTPAIVSLVLGILGYVFAGSKQEA